MRAYLSAAIAAVASAKKAHKFFAENNYICELCQTVVNYAKNDQVDEMFQIYDQFPALLERVNKYGDQAEEIVDYDDIVGTCQRLELCEDPDILELLMEEQPLNLQVHIDTPHANWVAGVNEKFEGASLKEVKMIMGTIVDPEWTINLPERHQYEVSDVTVPDDFDARTNWPNCASVINHIRDQANCGSCWAFGTTEALNDRACIKSNGSMTTLYSTADTTGCCGFLKCQSMGCNGGQVGTPWNWFESTGVVTGGQKGEGQLCYDYTMDKCAHHVTSATLPSCDDIAQVQPQCHSSCPTNSGIDYAGDKKKASSSYGIRSVQSIKEDIYQYGTVTAAFTVYEDFLTYKSGVYTHQSGSELGGHAIKLIGWGTEGGEDYWLAVNSWNDTWGDQGTFKIKQGECNINNQVHAGQAA